MIIGYLDPWGETKANPSLWLACWRSLAANPPSVVSLEAC